MKREDLKKIEGITDDQIDSIMKLHQTDAEAWKTEKETLKAEIKTKDTNIADLSAKIKDFDGVDVEGLKKQAKDLEKKYQAKLEDAKKEGLIGIALSKAGAKNEKMLRAMIDMSKVTMKDGELSGLSDQIESIKKENDFLFGKEKQEVELGGNHDDGGKPGQDAVTDIFSAVNDFYK